MTNAMHQEGHDALIFLFIEQHLLILMNVNYNYVIEEFKMMTPSNTNNRRLEEF